MNNPTNIFNTVHASSQLRSLFALLGLLVLMLTWNPPVWAKQHTSIGPGYFTFPEIAEQLSRITSSNKQRVRVTCAPTLRNRVAFISLKERPVDEIKNLIAAGLDVQFRVMPSKQEANKKPATIEWVMEWDAKVSEREKKWRTALERALQRVKAQYLTLAGKYARQPREALENHLTLVRKEKKEIEESFTSDKWPTLKRLVYEEELIRSILSDYVAFSLGYNWLEKQNQFLSDDLLRWGVATDASNFPFPVIFRNAQQTSPAQKATAPKPAFYQPSAIDSPEQFIGHFSLRDGTFNARISLFAGNTIPVTVPVFTFEPEEPRIDFLFRGGVNALGETYPGLGSEAVAWLEENRTKTREFLACQTATTNYDRPNERIATAKTEDPTGPQILDALSAHVALWSEAQHQEVIMELWLEGDVTSTQPPTNLAQVFAGVEKPWLFSIQNKVVFVKNALAFLQRPRHYPLAALFQLRRTQQARNFAPWNEDERSAAMQVFSGKASLLQEQYPLYSELKIFLEQCLVQGKPVVLPESSYFQDRYYQFSVLDMNSMIVGLYLWEHLPAEQKDKIQSILKGKQETSVSIPFSTYTDKDRQFVVEWLRRQNDRISLDRKLPELLAKYCQITVRLVPGPSAMPDARRVWIADIIMSPDRPEIRQYYLNYSPSYGIRAIFRWDMP